MLTAYKAFHLAIAAVFAVAVSDWRRKPGMVALMSCRWVTCTRIIYPVLLAVFAWVVLGMEQVRALDLATLGLTGAGTALVVKARIDLGSNHTWAGYQSASGGLVTRGIYAWMRHALYAGVYCFIGGGMISVAARAPWYVTSFVALSVAYVAGFLVVSARRESLLLQEQYGEAFVSYRDSVHPFLPLQRYKEAPDE